MAKPRAVPVDEALWEQAKAEARRSYRVWPSPPASAYAAGWYKDRGGRWSGQQPIRKRLALARNMNRNSARLNANARVSGTHSGGSVSSATSFKMSSPKMPMFKFAVSRRPPPPKSRWQKEMRAATNAGAGALGAFIVGTHGLVKANRDLEHATGKELVEMPSEIHKSMSGHLIEHSPKGLTFGMEDTLPTAYFPFQHHVNLTGNGVSPFSISHEIGHAHQRVKMGPALSVARQVAKKVLYAPLAGAVQYARLHDTNPAAARKWAGGTAALGALSLGGVLAHEADATRRGMGMLRAAQAAGSGLTDAHLSNARQAGNHAFKTYASAGAIPLGALGLVVGGYALRDALRRRRKPMKKQAGGPGSGVRFHNTELITGYDQSPVVNLHNREKIMAASAPERKGVWIKLSRVKFVGQRKYVVAKLGRMLAAADADATPDWAKIPVKLYFDGTAYHVMDGHHRFLAAARLHRDRIKADVWTEVPQGLEKGAGLNLASVAAGLAVGTTGYQALRAVQSNKRRHASLKLFREAQSQDGRVDARKFEASARRQGFAGSFHHAKNPNPTLGEGHEGSYNPLFDDKPLLQEAVGAMVSGNHEHAKNLLSSVKAKGNRKAQMYVPSEKGKVSRSAAFHELGHHRSFQQSGDAYAHNQKMSFDGDLRLFGKATDHPQYKEESRAWDNARHMAKQEKAGPISDGMRQHSLDSYQHNIQMGKHFRRGLMAASVAPGLAIVANALRKHGSALEAVAAAEHRQWESWARSLMLTLKQKGEKGLAKRVRAWKPLFVSYSKLSEEDKEKDREWARKAIAARTNRHP